jgi:hypothetical protein
VSLWIFTEASRQELVWALASLAVGAVLVLLTARAATARATAAGARAVPSEEDARR